MHEGRLWLENPKLGDEVLMPPKALTTDDAIIKEKANVEYEVGSGAFGSLSKAVDKALANMRKDKETSSSCSKGYAYKDSRTDGATIDLILSEVFKSKDVSFDGDKSVVKKQFKADEGYNQPKDCAKANVLVKAVTDGQSALPSLLPTRSSLHVATPRCTTY